MIILDHWLILLHYIGNSIWHEKCRVRAANQIRYGCSIICILWEGQHGEQGVRLIHKEQIHGLLELNYVLFSIYSVVHSVFHILYETGFRLNLLLLNHFLFFGIWFTIMSGCPCCSNPFHRINIIAAGCNFSLFPLPQRRNCGIQG